MSCSVGCRCGSDPVLLWLWHRLAATVLIQPLAWELPCAKGVVLNRQKKKKKKKERIEKKMKETIPFPITSKSIKYLETNLTK